MDNQIVWVDIPVVNLDRAINFYSKLLNNNVEKQVFENFAFGVLPHAHTNVSGCLVLGDAEQITTAGPLIYFNVDGRLKDALAQSLANGGELLEDIFTMGEHGHRAVVKDSEGNRIALHSSTL